MERVKVSVDEGYSRWARDYDAYPNALIAAEEPLVRALVGDVRGKRVLDVACGTGRHTLFFADAGALVVGIDRNAEMLAVARGKRASLDLREGDVERLPVPDASFDVVVSALVMEHVRDIRPALADARRVLAPGGVFVLSVFHPAFLWKGVPLHFESDGGVEYEMPAFVHLASDYVRTLLELGLTLGDFHEPVVDDALVARFPNMEKHRDLPIAIVLRATRAPCA